MVSKIIVSQEVKLVYHDLVGNYGFYRIRPGKQPYICLSNMLLQDGQEAIHYSVFAMLLDLHRSIPADSFYRLFPLRRYYEDFMPEEEPVKPEIIIIGRAQRQWKFTFYDSLQVEAHLVG